MKKDDLVFIKHILDYIKSIEESTNTITREDFDSNNDLRDATIRRIEIIGEASKNISKELKDSHPEVKWKEIIGTRDRIIHKYFEVEWDIVWNIATIDISELKKQINAIKEEIEKKS